MVHIITVITDDSHQGYSFFLKESARLNNLHITAITIGLEEDIGYREKDRQLKKWLDNMHEDEIVLFTDGYDAIFLAEAEEITRKFHRFNKKIVFSTETNCWPDKSLSEKYPPSAPTVYRYLNSGGFIGEAGAIRHLLHQPATVDENDFPWSNQYYWTLKYFKNPEIIGLDYGCEIFCTMSPESGSMNDSPQEYYKKKKEWFVDTFDIANGRVYNKMVKSWPCHLHFNGASKCLMDQTMTDCLFFEGDRVDRS